MTERRHPTSADAPGAPDQDGGVLSRRGFVGASLAVAAALGTVPFRPWASLVAVGDAPLAEQLGAILPDTASVRAVGEAYLLGHGQHRDLRRLLVAVAADLGIEPDGRPPTGLGGRARQAVHDDLAARRTVTLDGWVASPTEARLAAMTLHLHRS